MSVVEASDYFFLDTNILVYGLDPRDPVKQALAQRILQEALESRRGTISTQVVQEFIHLSLRKFEQPMTLAECRKYVHSFLLPLCKNLPSISTYERVLDTIQETGYSLYDALIVTAAVESGCRTLYTEDLQHGRVIQGMRIVNPFLPEGA